MAEGNHATSKSGWIVLGLVNAHCSRQSFGSVKFKIPRVPACLCLRLFLLLLRLELHSFSEASSTLDIPRLHGFLVHSQRLTSACCRPDTRSSQKPSQGHQCVRSSTDPTVLFIHPHESSIGTIAAIPLGNVCQCRTAFADF